MFVTYTILVVALVLLSLGFYLPRAFEKKYEFIIYLGKAYIGVGSIFLIVSIYLFLR